MNWCVCPVSGKWRWKWISGACSPSQSRDARSVNHRVHVSRLKAFAVSAGLSVLFLVVYGGFHLITRPRQQDGSVFFFFGGPPPLPPFFFFSLFLFPLLLLLPPPPFPTP